MTPERKIIFQKRGMNKETFPGLLDATAGGHVDIGQDYLEAAEREAFEETGIRIPNDELVFVEKHQSKTIDTGRNLINNKFLSVYGFLYKGSLEDLKLEDKEALGFEEYSMEEIESLSEEDKKKFIPKLLVPDWIALYKKIIEKINATQSKKTS